MESTKGGKQKNFNQLWLSPLNFSIEGTTHFTVTLLEPFFNGSVTGMGQLTDFTVTFTVTIQLPPKTIGSGPPSCHLNFEKNIFLKFLFTNIFSISGGMGR